MYDSQIVHHNLFLNLFILHNNSFDNQGSEINKNDIFLRFVRHTVFYKNFLPTTHSINLHLPIIALVLDFDAIDVRRADIYICLKSLRMNGNS